MRVHNPGVVALLLAVVLAGGPQFGLAHADGGPGEAIDAEAGGDAGETQATATMLSSTGSYTGAFQTGTDTDWYRLDVASDESICVEARVQADANVVGVVSMTATLADEYAANDAFSDGTSADLSFLLPGGSTVYLGLAPSSGGPPGNYTFEFETYTRDELSGESQYGADAGNTRATAVYIPEGCIRGSLDSNLGDSVDWFKFRGEEGEALVLALRSEDESVPLTLVAPNGDDIATVSGSQVAKVQLDTSGTWYLRIGTQPDTSPDGVTTNSVVETLYEASLTDDSPCRPFCLDG